MTLGQTIPRREWVRKPDAKDGWQCKGGTFNWLEYRVSQLKNVTSVFFAPIGAIVWLISKFFIIVADFCADLAKFAL